MRPMEFEAVEALVALLGRAPHHAPLPPLRQRYNLSEEAQKIENHPLQVWVDQLPPFQNEQVHMHYIHYQGGTQLTQEAWDRVWATAIFNALWF